MGLKLRYHHRDTYRCIGLNRTSVGLKRGRDAENAQSGRCLNRTSVGLKHERPERPQLGQVGGLNRTSVGLKRVRRAHARANRFWPQSNQRGIETIWLQMMENQLILASIEPAWD